LLPILKTFDTKKTFVQLNSGDSKSQIVWDFF
jgi:hypothetical protein